MSYKKLKAYLEAWETEAAAKRTAIWTAARTRFLALEAETKAKRRSGMMGGAQAALDASWAPFNHKEELTHRIEQIQRDLEVLADLVRKK